MTVGTAPGVQAALADTGVVDEVVYVCRHRYYTSRRLCWWRPGGYRFIGRGAGAGTAGGRVRQLCNAALE